jgi:hypothetical protein
VKNPEGKEIGRSEIVAMAGGCAIRETWKSSNGITGTSINFYDAQTRHWHQHWVGSDGSILHLEGGVQEKAMVLAGQSIDEGRAVENRITWTPLADGKVRQEWTTSADSGASWKSSFVGIYER